MSSGELATLSGRYRLRHRVGSGMMSSVYVADDLVFERTVAIKVLAPEFTADDQMMTRFRREAQAAAKLDHSAFLRMFDIVSDGDTTFIVMEYANGPSLAQVLQTDGERSVSFATDVAWEVAIALRYVHGLGIILRHLSPSSIYLAPRGVKLAHFGIKPFLEPNAERYMAPEELASRHVTERSDLYSLGVVMFEMVTGKCPPRDDSHSARPLFGTFRADVLIAYQHVVERLLELDPQARYPSADTVVHELAALRGPATTPYPPVEASPQPSPLIVSRTRPRIFMSYCHDDKEQMQLVEHALEQADFDVWNDSHLVPGTPSWIAAIEEAIGTATGLVVVLTPRAKASPWVQREVTYAQLRSIPIYPVLAVGAREDSMPLNLVQHQYVDLNRDSTDALRRLVTALEIVVR